MTKLDKPLRREVNIDATPYTLTLDQNKLKLTRKGHRRGMEVAWPALLKLAGFAQAPIAPAEPVT